MAAPTTSKSLKDYLKKYESSNVEEKKKKEKKKEKKKNGQEAKGVLVVDEDPVWQKPVNLEENEDESAEEMPLIDEDIEVKRMRRLEQIKARRAYNAIAEDGSGWVSVSSKPANAGEAKSDISPPRRQRTRNDSPSPEPHSRPSVSDREETDMSPPRRRKRHYTPSPKSDRNHVESIGLASDLSPPRKRQARNDSPSPEPEDKVPKMQAEDLSPPRRRQYHPPSPESSRKPSKSLQLDADLSLPLRKKDRHGSLDLGLSPPRKTKEDLCHHSRGNVSRNSDLDMSPPRKPRKESPSRSKIWEQRKTGLISGRDIRDEILKSKKDEFSRFKEMDPMLSGRNAEPVFRDKIKGERISKEDYLKSKQKVEEKPKEIKLEWGKGLAQKREAEARLQELEHEKDKPFARSRDDPELDNMLKDRLRWGDPMAHLVKKKQPELALPNLGNNEKMKESGFIIPQDVPKHSWLKRGLEAAPNRYGIRPGRHWDGVDRSNGYEKQMFKRMNEKRATEREAYLWSVSDM